MECLIREATSDDCEHLMSLIQEIAAFHHLLDDVTINSQVLKADGFGKDPFYKCIVAELPVENGRKQACPIGYALYFFGYSVNHGRMVYLENLYVVSECRGKGIGKQLLSKVAEIALAAGCVEMKFVTMEWNHPAKEFYNCLGAHDATESEQLHCMELGHATLQRLVQSRKEL
ncbi:thialysine N-epsilon-acetyltransferase-like [Rhineura floridana]|uniref:thialysine N-epsilon-acetyltransferase-like n=1 Tax=Rhineura floridana TaxID=261503 RepID=UPI002AC83C3F|nr:thialysine N-epsilon-acetyltransferase-like [Rhineura floridana]